MLHSPRSAGGSLQNLGAEFGFCENPEVEVPPDSQKPGACSSLSSGAAVQRYSQQRHLGGIGAPAAAEQPLAYTGALCRARTRVRREQELS